jgi:hypothetical protein
MVIHNILQDTTVEKLEETILDQNTEPGLVSGDIAARFKFRTKWDQAQMVTEVGSETRKKLLNKKTETRMANLQHEQLLSCEEMF